MKRKHTLLQSIGFSLSGLLEFFRTERNGMVQLIISVAVLCAAGVIGLTTTEWIMVLLCIGMVNSLEMLNSAIEKICDFIQPDEHPVIKLIKDISAAAVLWISVISMIIGLLIFIPKIKIII